MKTYKAIYVIGLSLLMIKQAGGQAPNLAPNPSFEDTLTCQDFFNLQMQTAMYVGGPVSGWYGINTVDYFSVFTVPGSPCQNYYGWAPSSIFGYKYPRTGDVMLGITSIFIPTLFNGFYTEWIFGRLSSQLIQGHQYCVSFYVSLSGKSSLAISKLGAIFTPDTLWVDLAYLDTAINYLQAYYGSSQISNPASNFITDTSGWTLIQGRFTAQGNERYIIIGCIYPKQDVDTLPVNSLWPNPLISQTYYYIDDVSVTDCTAGIGEEPGKEPLQIKPTLAGDYIELEYKPLASGKCRAEVFNSLGSRVKETELKKGAARQRIAVAELPPGMYFVRVQSTRHTAVGKFVKQ